MLVLPHRLTCCAVVLATLVGCYDPAPPEGVACETAQQCPAPQQCVRNRCSLGGPPPIDARLPDEADAAVDAAAAVDAPPPDAPPLPCNTDGLTCAGPATSFVCGGQCWVKCTVGVRRAAAQMACAGWQGALAQIDDQVEQDCARTEGGAVWIGLIQTDGEPRTDSGFTWNGGTPLGATSFQNWQAGAPDDGDDAENGAQQCVQLQSDHTWDDEPCNTNIDFVCLRP